MIYKKESTSLSLHYPLEQKFQTCLSELLFFDIETTGLSRSFSQIYLIGAISYEDGWQISQWMAETPDEESLILNKFFSFAAAYRILVHFNGTRFDLPCLKQKSERFHLNFPFNSMQNIDLYQLIRPLKKFLKLERMNQVSLEEFLNLNRKDTYDGGSLVPIYHEYSKTNSPSLLELLLLHNHDDLFGMFHLIPMLSYVDFHNGGYAIDELLFSGETPDSFTILLKLRLDTPLPKQISLNLPNAYLTAEEDHAGLLINGYKGCLKYFFPDYKNYYYLPQEDTAIHKSIASYVEREHRVQAKASTCYCNRSSLFLLQKKGSKTAAFKKHYADSESYFECTPEFIKDHQALYQYSLALIQNEF